ncbi:hypothetical protein SNOG_03461 [Parastagonospora nodorum SN15]|uniref:Uncharacterized protein n=1 Tax=Phaeosphaeria nodorum (strain SN15 / ATCC MYA-4574 / FGSC 10173) TaxID=321614 RepID=Q0UXQ3_PHANO|nr:hypothetical protein SNOG_03461 [Parastagonospora nodorum SN15]EAT88666.1 hypothetical protein SNOG_03461 [Parastagonospora nodorum SN15]
MSILSVNMGDQPVSPQGSTDIAADIALSQSVGGEMKTENALMTEKQVFAQ